MASSGAMGLSRALEILAIKIAVDALLGGLALSVFGADLPALGLCALSAVAWIPILTLIHLRTRQVDPDRRGFRWWPTRPFNPIVIVAVGVAVIGAALGLSFLARDLSSPLEDAIRSRADLVAVAVFALTVAPLVEEVFFRGFLYAAIEDAVGGRTAVVVVGLLFGVFHGFQYAGVPAALAAVTLMGLATTWVRRATGGVAPCIALHVAYNVAGVLVLILGGGGPTDA
jgi:membrane protease YdiL (CAAX protease family)